MHTSRGCQSNLQDFHTSSMDSQLVPPVHEELLPHIHDDITLHHIATKLPRTSLNALYSVSCSWREAFESGKVYKARHICKATETLLVFKHTLPVFKHTRPDDHYLFRRISLYSVREKVLYHLPITGLDFGIPLHCRILSLEGKIYVLGGGWTCRDPGNQDLYVYDVFGQSLQWKQCASMSRKRHGFVCHIFHGKIYVFGGTAGNGHLICHSEVYDPKLNIWSPIKPMLSRGVSNFVTRVGEELLVQGGANLLGQDGEYSVCSCQVYNPVKDEWRILEPTRMGLLNSKHQGIFMAQGKFWWTSKSGFYSYDMTLDMNANSGHSCRKWISRLAEAIQQNANVTILCKFFIPVNNELFGMVRWRSQGRYGDSILQSRGFSNNPGKIRWERILNFRYEQLLDFTMCSIEL